MRASIAALAASLVIAGCAGGLMLNAAPPRSDDIFSQIHPGMTRDEVAQLIDRVWGDVVVDLHTVDNFVSSLKKKLSVKKGSPGFELKTVRGVGFRWVC